MYLNELGLSSPDDLFRSIPQAVKLSTDVSLPHPYSEIEIRRFFDTHGDLNQYDTRTLSFLGGIAHHHYIPSVINSLVSRGEFLTAYTPYQPEVSQGTLQVIYEYQSMMADLMGVEVSNASLYDGSTSLVEAILMSKRITGKNKVIIAGELNTQYLDTLKTYFHLSLDDIRPVSSEKETGQIDLNELESKISDDTCCVVVQSPNAIGIIERISSIKECIGKRDVLLIVVVTEAQSLALLKSPGSCGADVVCGEAQSFGIPVSFGGPYLGMFGSSMKFIRSFPGRLVGETNDVNGNRGFVVTLSTREQHIRRDKATSNICTNQGLMALRAAIYLSVMGKEGLRHAAIRSAKAAQIAREEIRKVAGIKVVGNGPIFNEFVMETELDAMELFEKCYHKSDLYVGNIVGKNRILASFNETMTFEIIEKWITAVQGAING